MISHLITIERKKLTHNLETLPSCHLIDTLLSSDLTTGRSTLSGTLSAAGVLVVGRSAAAALGAVRAVEVWNARLEYLLRARVAKGALFPERMVWATARRVMATKGVIVVLAVERALAKPLRRLKTCMKAERMLER